MGKMQHFLKANNKN